MRVILVASLLSFCIVRANPLLEERAASSCTEAKCALEDNCRCSSSANPLLQGRGPQLIALTFDEAVVDNQFRQFWQPLLFHRKNPDGNNIRVTYFVPHEYTDYERVQQLYLHGFEIGVHSVTKNNLQSYWRSASLEDLVQEFKGQRQIISRFANIPIEDLVGARTPQLQIEGDVTIDAYTQSGIIYDNSWPTLSSRHLFPYTLDYASTQQCTVTIKCPQESHPGFWIIPITNIVGTQKAECNSLVTCEVNGTAEEIAAWLLDQVNRVRNGDRSPINLRVDTYWFYFTKNSYDGLVLFLDKLAALDDVFLVSQSEVLEWVKHPVPLEDYETKPINRSAYCDPVNCELSHPNGGLRYMKSCVPCPVTYPWLGNPYGNAYLD